MRLGDRRLPTVEIAVKMQDGSGRLVESAMIDTGSVFTVLPERLLHIRRFPMHRARQLKKPVISLGGETPLFYLEKAVLAVRDSEGALHPINLERLFFTKAELPPLVGREVMKQLNARLFLDFLEENGRIDVG